MERFEFQVTAKLALDVSVQDFTLVIWPNLPRFPPVSSFPARSMLGNRR